MGYLLTKSQQWPPTTSASSFALPGGYKVPPTFKGGGGTELWCEYRDPWEPVPALPTTLEGNNKFYSGYGKF